MLKNIHQKMIKSALVLALMAVGTSSALPKATELVSEMGLGYNIGNTMEVPNDPTLWGNTIPTKVLIDSLKAAGFNTVRIPTAWYTHSDTSTNTIKTEWIAEVKKLVDYCIANNMYVILNSHWDNGWLEDEVFNGSHPDRNGTIVNTDASKIRARQEAYWTQIATAFKDYDQHLIFAGANEPGVNDHRGGTSENGYTDNGQYAFNQDRMQILKTYYQAFIDAVRSTGGNNGTRTLIIQAPRTEIDKVDLLLNDMPTDPAGAGYLMGEVHFYPYQFSLMTEDADWGKCYYYWGNYLSSTDAVHNTPASGFASPSWVDEMLSSVSTKFAAKQMPVVIGEFGAVKRLSLSGDNLKLHLQSRAAFYGAVAKNSKNHGMIPVLWDTGDEGEGNMTVIRRQKGTTGSIFDYEVLNSMLKAYGLDTLQGNSIDALVNLSTDTSNKSVLVETKASPDTFTTTTIRITPSIKDWSNYTAVSFLGYVDGTTHQVDTAYGFASIDLAVMSGTDWAWDDVHSQELTMGQWAEFKYTLSKNINDTAQAAKNQQKLYIKNPTSINALVMNLYSLGFEGEIRIDNVVLWKADGTKDTLETFNKKLPTTEGNVSNTELVATVISGPIKICASPIKTLSTKLRFTQNANQLNVSFESERSSKGTLVLMNSLGQVIAEKSISVEKGLNTVSLKTGFRGVAFVQLRQQSSSSTAKVIIK